jgi:hypothetical protein
VKQAAWDIYRYCWSCLRASLLHCYIALQIVLLTVANLTRIASSNRCAQGKNTSGFGTVENLPWDLMELRNKMWDLSSIFYSLLRFKRRPSLSAPHPLFPFSLYTGVAHLCASYLEREVLRDDVDTLSILISGACSPSPCVITIIDTRSHLDIYPLCRFLSPQPRLLSLKKVRGVIR